MASVTNLTDVANQVQEIWSPLFTKELRETHLLPNMVNKDYQGEISNKGDTVYVSQINAPTGQLLTVGTNADAFSPEAISTSRVSILANKRAVASYEVEDLVDIQSQIDKEDSEIRASLAYAVGKQINDYLFTVVSPSTSAPDHELSSVTDLNAAQMSAIRVLAGTAKWLRNKPWFGLLSPQYNADVMDDTTLASRDFGGDDRPFVSGVLGLPRMGFQMFEDNSQTGDYGLFFHPDFMHLVMQTQVTFKISDLHAQKRFGYVISADIIFGASLGVSGGSKHIRVQ